MLSRYLASTDSLQAITRINRDVTVSEIISVHLDLQVMFTWLNLMFVMFVYTCKSFIQLIKC